MWVWLQSVRATKVLTHGEGAGDSKQEEMYRVVDRGRGHTCTVGIKKLFPYRIRNTFVHVVRRFLVRFSTIV